MGKYDVRVSAKQVHKRRHITRLLLIILLCLLLIMSLVYACTSFVNRAGRFTINLDPDAMTKYGISISSTDDFKKPTILLQGTALENMWNITQEWILNDPADKEHYEKGDPTYKTFEDIDKVDGDHNGKNYIAYTFYIKNEGTDKFKESVAYYGSLDIKSAVKGADEAIRVMVFQNGQKTVFGKKPLRPNEPYADFGIEKEFAASNKVMEVTRRNFKVGDVDKYTIIIWLEGWDPECVDNIKGGEVTLSMNFKVLEEKAGETELV